MSENNKIQSLGLKGFQNKGVYLLTDVDFELEYEVYDHQVSKPHLFVFHGFGRTYPDFETFNLLFEDYNVVGINLFFHGRSTFSNEVITPVRWNQIFSILLTKIRSVSYDLMAYSMGGKFLLSLLEDKLISPNNVYLLAADGLKIRPSYFFATRTWLGQGLSNRFAKDPSFVLGLVKRLVSIGLINERLSRFIYRHTENEEARKKVIKVWQVFKPISPNLNRVAENAKKNKTEFYLLFGNRDFVIEQNDGKKLKNLLETQCKIVVVSSGHNFFHSDTEQKLVEILGKKKGA